MRYALTAMAFTLLSSPALAQDKGLYLGLGAGMSEYKDACDEIPAGVSCDDGDTATKIFGGYKFSPNFAVEAGYTDLGKASASQAGVGSVSLEASGFEVVAVGIVPLNPKWSLYGKLGAFVWDVDLKDNGTGLVSSESESGTGLTYAFGVNWDFTRNLSARLEYQVYSDIGDEDTTGEGDVNVIGASLIFRF
jgi:OOP family OmpA-OmpF porin